MPATTASPRPPPLGCALTAPTHGSKGCGGIPHPARMHTRRHSLAGGAQPQGERGRWLSVTASGHLHKSLLLEPKRKASQPELQSPGPSPPYPCLAQPPPTTTNDFLIVKEPVALLCSCPPSGSQVSQSARTSVSPLVRPGTSLPLP